MPCNIGCDAVVILSAYDYLNSKLETAPTAEAKRTEQSRKFEKATTLCEAVVSEYTLLMACHSSTNAYSHLTNDRFFDLSSLCLAISNQGQSNAVKVNTSAITIEHDEWQNTPEPRPQSTTAPSTLACTFWLSMQFCDQDSRKYLRGSTCVLGGKLVFPYLTVDFRKDQEHIDDARRRAACNGAQVLFNRHRLYAKTREMTQGAKRVQDNAIHRHFMIVFDDTDYEGWQITADKDNGWSGKGCTMRRIFYSTLLDAESVKDLYGWIHEIHCWAATQYGPACIEEIRTCLQGMNSKQDPAVVTTG